MSGAAQWTPRYVRDRERVLGRRLRLSLDPEIAAEQLAEHLGGISRARRWTTEVVAALEGRRR